MYTPVRRLIRHNRLVLWSMAANGNVQQGAASAPDLLDSIALGVAARVAEHVRAELRQPEPENPMGWLNSEGARRYLGGMSERQLARHVQRGEIRAYKPAGRYLFRPGDLDEWVEGGRIGPSVW
jgi:Helix-turn-helix domain